MYLSSISSRLLLYDINTWDLKKSYGCYDGILRDISWSDDSKYILQLRNPEIFGVLSRLVVIYFTKYSLPYYGLSLEWILYRLFQKHRCRNECEKPNLIHT